MIELAASTWTTALARISTRHKGVYVVVRVYEEPGMPSGVVLWHTPLQAIRVMEESNVEILAGDPVTPIEYTITGVRAIFADFTENREYVRRLHFESATGNRTVMQFEDR